MLFIIFSIYSSLYNRNSLFPKKKPSSQCNMYVITIHEEIYDISQLNQTEVRLNIKCM